MADAARVGWASCFEKLTGIVESHYPTSIRTFFEQTVCSVPVGVLFV